MPRVAVLGALAAFGVVLSPALALGHDRLPAANSTKPADEATRRIAQHGRWFVDSGGRVFTVRGGNVSLPDPRTGEGSDRWSADTPRRLAEQGFNGVRLVIFLSGLMPEPGKIDRSYLDRIAQTVAAYKAAGVYTLIDFHQDEYSAVVGVRGMPAWAVFSDGFERMPGVGFPIGYFVDPAVQRSFDNFYANHPVAGAGKGVQDFYIDGLTAVAQRFRDEPAVLGIDVMNEPATGSRCASSDPAKANCPELEQELLKPFYERAAAAINLAAPDLMVFVEPFMLQAGLGIPIKTPIAGAAGRRALSFHNYGPVREIRDRINGDALAQATASEASIINTEWGFSNEPADIVSQADDFDERHISWLAWTRGSFEALVDPSLPDRGNGNRIAMLRAYARPYAEIVAGTPDALDFDAATGVMRLTYGTVLPDGRSLGQGETQVRIPAVHFPHGYTVTAVGGDVTSEPNAPLLRVRNQAGAARVSLVVSRIGELPPVPSSTTESDQEGAMLRALPPIPPGPLNRQSLLGHIVVTPGGRSVIDREMPGLLKSLSHVHGVSGMTLAVIQQLNSSTLTEERMQAIEAGLQRLKVTPGPAQVREGPHLSIDSLTADLVADPRAREILEAETPGLVGSPKQGMFPQTRLRNLQPEFPNLLTDEALDRIQRALDALR